MRRNFASQRGIGMVAVVIIVVLTVILATTALLLYAHLQHLQLVQKELQLRKTEADKRVTYLEDKFNKSLEATGLRGMEKPDEVPLGRAADRWKQACDAVFAPMPDKLANYSEDNKGKLQDIEQRIADKRKEFAIYPTLEDVLEIAALRLFYVKDLNDQHQLNLQIAETHAKALQEMKGPVTARKDAYIKFLTNEINDVNKKIQAEDDRYKARHDELAASRDAAATGIEQENARYYEWEIKIKNLTRELVHQLEELKIKEAIKYDIDTVHGHVISPDAPNKTAFIDIGSRDRVVPGLKFMAAKRGNMGKLVYKAVLIVKKVWPTHCEVAISHVFNKEAPVIDGDLIINPLFNTRRAIVVCFAGEEGQPSKIRPSWDVKEASRRIQEIGSEVRTGVSPDIDFVIFTEAATQKQQTAYANFVKAVTLGVPYEEAAEIYKFLGE